MHVPLVRNSVQGLIGMSLASYVCFFLAARLCVSCTQRVPTCAANRNERIWLIVGNALRERPGPETRHMSAMPTNRQNGLPPGLHQRGLAKECASLNASK
jgi:hypothetical protein